MARISTSVLKICPLRFYQTAMHLLLEKELFFIYSFKKTLIPHLTTACSFYFRNGFPCYRLKFPYRVKDC
jgi:hypothetical protein